uniref:Uncharacterized protein n=1 Tax=uncultured delta proteobacterium HF0200_39N20 TaxID=710833 RepID=E0XUS7_9DELT|nr:hypothetical protein [uncultured delta proteobacterium HF0200_39N20]
MESIVEPMSRTVFLSVKVCFSFFFIDQFMQSLNETMELFCISC